MPIAVGETFERYEIESLIGRGGMGEVYRASDTRLRRKVALKVLRADRESSDAVSRLFREARAAAVLTHPNTVAIHDLGEAEGHFYIVMELVSGMPLLAYVGDDRVPHARKLAWLVDIARALSAAHKAGVIHRDVKPSNVMVSDDDVVKVLDFGLARPLEPVSFRTAAGHVLGTPRYMAPEALGGGEVDARSDQYAFGLTAYELLAGKHPGGVLAGPGVPTSLHEVVPELSRSVADIVSRTLAMNAAHRFETMEDVAIAIEDAIAGRPVRGLDVDEQAAEPTARPVTEDLISTAAAGPVTVAITTTRAGGPGTEVVANIAASAPVTAPIGGGASPTEAKANAIAKLSKTAPLGTLGPAAAKAATGASATVSESESSVPTATAPPAALADVIVSPGPLLGPSGTLLDPNAIARASGRPPENEQEAEERDRPQRPAERTLMSREKPSARPDVAAPKLDKTLAMAGAQPPPSEIVAPRAPQTKPLSDLDVDTIANAKANAEAMAQLKQAVADADARTKAKEAANASTEPRRRRPEAFDQAVPTPAPSGGKFPTVIAVIVVLGICAFAGAYFGSKELAKRSAVPSAEPESPTVPARANPPPPASAAPTSLPSTNIMPLTDPTPSAPPSATAKPPKPAGTPRAPKAPAPTTPSGFDMKLR